MGRALQPNVDAVGLLARFLQGRAVGAVGTFVVLPGKVVNTPRIGFSAHKRFVSHRLSSFHRVSGRPLRQDRSLDEKRTIGTSLARHLLAEGVAHDERGAFWNVECLPYLVDVEGNDFCALAVAWVAHGEHHLRSACQRCGQGQSQQAKEEFCSQHLFFLLEIEVDVCLS